MAIAQGGVGIGVGSTPNVTIGSSNAVGIGVGSKSADTMR
jgi:hypothetical protein